MERNLKLCTISGAFILFFTSLAQANVVGVDTQNFNPTTSGLDFVTIQSSETLKPCVINFGLFINHAANTLPYFTVKKGEEAPRNKQRDQITGADLNIGMGIFKRFDLGLSIPQVIYQKVEVTDDYHGEFLELGNTEIRLNAKYRFWGEDSGGIAVVLSTNINRLQDNPYVGQEAGPSINGEVVMDTTIDRVALGLNLGYRKRSPGKQLANVPVKPLGDQGIGSAAASIHFPSVDTKLIFEIFGSLPIKSEDNLTARNLSTLEALLGLKFDATDNLAFHLGGGAGLGNGLASPQWRVYGGVNYAAGPVCGTDSKKLRATSKVKPSKKPAAAPLPTSTNEEDNPFDKAAVAGEETIVVRNIHFAFDKDNIVLTGAKDILAQLTAYLLKEPVFQHLTIEGHTDSMGSDAYNQNLSERRANTIKKYLVGTHHLDPNKIDTAGYGFRQPVADNGNYQGRQLNRRVEFKITR